MRNDIIQVMAYHSSLILIPSFLQYLIQALISPQEVNENLQVVNENVISVYQNLRLGVDK